MDKPPSAKQIIEPGLLLALLLFALLAPAGLRAAAADFLSPSERAWIKAHPEIRMAPDPYLAPIEHFDEQGRFTGISAEYVSLIEKKLSYRFKIVRLESFDEILYRARRREIDIANTVNHTPERAAYLRFSKPYLRVPNVIIVRQDIKGELKPEDLKQMRAIVYQKGYAIGDVIRQRDGLHQARAILDPVQALKDLSLGRIDAVVGNLATLAYYVNEQNLPNLRVAGDCDFDDNFTFASRQDWPELNTIINKTLAQISPAEHAAIRAKWIRLETAKFYQDRRFWLIVLVGLSLFAGVLLLMYIWNRALNRLVAQKVRELSLSQENLRQSEEKYRLIVENASEGIFVAQDARIVFANHETARILCASMAEIYRKSIKEFIHPLDQALVLSRHKQRLEGENPPSRYDFRIICPPDEVRWVELNTVRIDWQGRPATLNFIRDISALKRSEAEAMTAQANYLSLYENIMEAIVYVDREGRILEFNEEYRQMLGYEAEELRQLTYQDITPPKWWQMEADIIAQQVYTRGYSDVFEKEYIRKDGTVIPIELRVSLYRDLDGQTIGLCGMVRDIIERKLADEENAKLQLQLVQAQRMESIGRLAGGVAHDFNNMLGVVLGNAELALELTEPTHPLHIYLEEIHKAGLRSADLTRQLLAFARKQVVEPKVLDLNQSVEHMLKMLKRLIGENIELAWWPDPALASIEIDPSQLDQILANLTVNARDAIDGVGRISIETQNVVLDAEYCSEHVESAPGAYVSLTISDNGRGMDQATLSHLFEPFFTTKAVGQGTGLGLATVYGCVKQSGGFINVYSEPGQGTSFAIYLPQSQASGIDALPDDGRETPVGKHETILLVEDDPSLLNLSQSMLVKLGYEVLSANTAEEALALARTHGPAIRLLLSDVVMPEMNGRDLAGHLTTIIPSLKCLYMSGYTADVIAHHGVLEKGMHFIQKPFSKNDLARKLREALEAAENPADTAGIPT